MSANLHFSVGTYNVGNPAGNPYAHGYSDHGSAKAWKEDQIDIKEKITDPNNPYSASAGQTNSDKERLTEWHAAEKLTNCAVLLLQEVSVRHGKENAYYDREIISCLKTRDYEIIRDTPKSDCAIAINKHLFSDIKDVSHKPDKESPAYAAALATHNASGVKVLFLSLHLHGLNYANFSGHNESYGAEDLEKILTHLEKREDVKGFNCEIVGGDYNADPEILRNIQNNRFEKMKQHKFKCFRSNGPTNVNPHNSGVAVEREIDYQFAKLGDTPMKQKLLARYEQEYPLGKFDKAHKKEYNADGNRSDHIPVIVDYKLES